ncbi:hypothetical protein ACVW05_003289 [Pseudomonas fulva]
MSPPQVCSKFDHGYWIGGLTKAGPSYPHAQVAIRLDRCGLHTLIVEQPVDNP